MWFATNIGIARFDGEQWIFLTKKDGLADDLVNTLAKGSNGEMWIGTQSGISRWKDGKLTSFTNPDQLLGDIQSIAVDNQGKVWVASKNGLFSFDGETWKSYTYDWSFEGWNIWGNFPDKLAIAPNGTLWGFSGLIVFKVTGGEIHPWTLQGLYGPRYGEPVITDIAFGPDGSLWITTDRTGIIRFDGTNWVNFTKLWGLLEWDGTTAGMGPVVLGPDNAMWFGTGAYGVIRFDGKVWTSNFNNGLRTQQVASIGVGPDNAMWFGDGWGGTLSRFDGNSWKTYALDQVFGDSLSINSIVTGSDGDIWIGGCWFPNPFPSIYNAIWRFHNGEWIEYTSESRPGSECILSMAKAPDGALWFGTSTSGVWRFDGMVWKNYSTKDGLVSDEIRGMVFKPDGELWLVTEKGVSHFDGATWENFTPENGLPPKTNFPFYSAIGIDFSGRIWIGFDSGAADFNGKEWITAFHSDYAITSITTGPDGSIWFGTKENYTDEGNGVYRYKDGKLITYHTWDGLADNAVLSIAVGPDGAIWFGTERGGVSRFDWRQSTSEE